MYMSALNIGRTYYVTLLETETNSICPRSKTNHFQNKVIYNFTVFIIAISLYHICHFKTVTLSRNHLIPTRLSCLCTRGDPECP